MFFFVCGGLLSISSVFKNINATNFVNASGVRWFSFVLKQFLIILQTLYFIGKLVLLRTNPYKNQTKSQMSGKDQKLKFALLLHGGSP